jgi:hypothetical protein
LIGTARVGWIKTSAFISATLRLTDKSIDERIDQSGRV